MHDSWPRNKLSSPNVSADVDWRVTISCNSLVDYTNFPHDMHTCKFKMRSDYVNATLDVKEKKRETIICTTCGKSVKTTGMEDHNKIHLRELFGARAVRSESTKRARNKRTR